MLECCYSFRGWRWPGICSPWLYQAPVQFQFSEGTRGPSAILETKLVMCNRSARQGLLRGSYLQKPPFLVSLPLEASWGGGPAESDQMWRSQRESSSMLSIPFGSLTVPGLVGEGGLALGNVLFFWLQQPKTMASTCF